MVELGHVLPSDRPRGMGARWTSSRAPESPGRGGRLFFGPNSWHEREPREKALSTNNRKLRLLRQHAATDRLDGGDACEGHADVQALCE